MPIIPERGIARRKSWRLGAAALLPALLAGGCASMSNTDKGVLAGGGIGAGTGALIGSATGNTGLGAAVGGVIGAVSGGLVGNAVDKAERKAEEARLAAASAAPGPLGMTDIVQMTHQHIDDGIIISQIRTTGSVYHLSAQDIMWLKQNGVSDAVIREMQLTAARPARRVYTATPVYPVYVVPEPPPPPVRIGIGYTFYGGRCR
ncbi:MAG TPA: glycine zipper domain-containing protein [Gemmataceae bacterium]|nr:glycine zipper domain-containing protein [Gemmataceae bacterium]